MRWAFRTGFHIWSAAAFDGEGAVYISGFDMSLYAISQKRGKLIWKTDLGNPLVASPAVGQDRIYQAAMDGRIHALDRRSGKRLWLVKTGGHVYASVAIGQDETVYGCSADGKLYALEGETGKVKWAFDTGYAIRSSPALGPDPECKGENLVYFGGGEGSIYAIDLEGRRRWSFDSLSEAGQADYPNLNASPALGHTGLAIGSANGEVLWIPYDYYLSDGAENIDRRPQEGFRFDKAAWHFFSPGGLIGNKPANEEGRRIVHAAAVISLRLLSQSGGNRRGDIAGGSIRVKAEPNFAFRTALRATGAH